MQLSFRSSFSRLSIHFCPKCSMIIFQTLSFFMSSWLAIIWIVNQWLPHTTCYTHSSMTSDLLVEGLPLSESSFTSSYSSLNLSYQTRGHNLVLSPHTCWSISSSCDWVLPPPPPTDTKFQFYLLLGVYCLLFGLVRFYRISTFFRLFNAKSIFM